MILVKIKYRGYLFMSVMPKRVFTFFIDIPFVTHTPSITSLWLQITTELRQTVN